MLKDERAQAGGRSETEPLTYGAYLRVPELTSLQTPLGDPPVHDEMLFIIVQQAQELWFKQILWDMKAIIQALEGGDVYEAIRLLQRAVRIVQALSLEVQILATMPPKAFQGFRRVLSPASGFESFQFRELELASGLEVPTFLKLIERHVGLGNLTNDWPVTLRDAAYGVLTREVGPDPADAWTRVYDDPGGHPVMFQLAEVLSEYDVYFAEWRFHHIKLVERSIGGHVQGTAGSSGAGYLGKTMGYKFFPELWEARNRITMMYSGSPPSS
jgi:tryptophan 2,3-dioxygenase